jgi:hypothetical protein
LVSVPDPRLATAQKTISLSRQGTGEFGIDLRVEFLIDALGRIGDEL